jgi:hypothetical protein
MVSFILPPSLGISAYMVVMVVSVVQTFFTYRGMLIVNLVPSIGGLTE